MQSTITTMQSLTLSPPCGVQLTYLDQLYRYQSFACILVVSILFYLDQQRMPSLIQASQLSSW